VPFLTYRERVKLAYFFGRPSMKTSATREEFLRGVETMPKFQYDSYSKLKFIKSLAVYDVSKCHELVYTIKRLRTYFDNYDPRKRYKRHNARAVSTELSETTTTSRRMAPCRERCNASTISRTARKTNIRLSICIPISITDNHLKPRDTNAADYTVLHCDELMKLYVYEDVKHWFSSQCSSQIQSSIHVSRVRDPRLFILTARPISYRKFRACDICGTISFPQMQISLRLDMLPSTACTCVTMESLEESSMETTYVMSSRSRHLLTGVVPLYGTLDDESSVIPFCILRDLARFGIDPVDHLARAGQRLRICCVCQRPLTQTESILGLGAWCLQKLRAIYGDDY